MTQMPRLPQPGAEFSPPPEGTWPAVCYRIVDLGTQPQMYKGQPSDPKHIVMISWELHDDECKTDDGRPMTMHRRFTWSSSPKSNLRKTLEAWRGTPFQDADFGTFDIRNLLGAPCLMQVVHAVRDGNTYANVGAVVKLPKGMPAPKPVNNTSCVWLHHSIFDAEAFEALSDKMKDTIKGSPEYQEMISGEIPLEEEREPADDEEMPF